MANTKKSTRETSGKKSYPNSKFNNKAIEKAEKNAVNVNVALDRKKDENATEDYLEEIRKKKEMMDDIIIICTILAAILLFLSLFDLCGIIGGFLKNVMMGFMGSAVSYAFPFLLVAFVIFTRSNKGNPVATRKSIYFWIMIALICGLINLGGHYSDTFQFVASFKAKQGGGLIGELVSCPLHALFGNLASILIISTLILVCLMLITGKAVIHAVRKKRAEKKAMLRELAEAERAEEERRQEEAAKRKSATNATYQEYKQMSLDDIQEVNRRQKPVFVDVDTTPSGPVYSGIDIYEPPKPKKKLSVIDRLKGYGKKDPEVKIAKKNKNLPDITHYQPIINQTAPVPAYQSEMDRKFGQQPKPVETDKAKPRKEEMLNSNYSYDDDGSAIPNIFNQTKSPDYQFIDPEPVKPYVPPVDETKADALRQGESVQTGAIISGYSNTVPLEEVKKKAVEKVSDESDIEITQAEEVNEKPYIFPRIELLKRPEGNQVSMSSRELNETAAKLERTLHSFGVNVTVTNYTSGPNVTRYELQPEIGTKVSKITSLADDIKLNLAAEDIRIEAPIPGKSAVGIEVPNSKGSTVYIRSLLESEKFQNNKGKITFAVGKDIAGDTVVADIAKMPHVLIAGATGSGKSVCINTIIMSILYKYEPKEVKLIMIDPKVVELGVYNGIPHLLTQVVTDPKKAYGALNWAVQEMMDRYKRFAELEVRDIEAYNEKIRQSKKPLLDNGGNKRAELVQILIIVDEMADLMMVSPGEVEDANCRLAQLARAAGIHLVLATQRPTVNVITGLIKANVPSRIAFSVASATDSRTILDQIGAEKLLGKGDMLFFPSGIPKPIRVQGAFVSDSEVKAVVDEIKTKNSGKSSYSARVTEQIDKASTETGKKSGFASMSDSGASNESDHDEYFAEAGRFIIEKDKASIGLLQRMYKIGFNRAARIMDQLAEAGVVGPEEGTKPRTILMTKEQFENYLEQNGG